MVVDDAYQGHATLKSDAGVRSEGTLAVDGISNPAIGVSIDNGAQLSLNLPLNASCFDLTSKLAQADMLEEEVGHDFDQMIERYAEGNGLDGERTPIKQLPGLVVRCDTCVLFGFATGLG